MQHAPLNYGSTPHLGQQQQQNFQGSNQFAGGGGFTLRSAPTNRDYPPNQYVDDQGRYVGQPPASNMHYNRECSPYQVGRTNSYNPMANNGNNGGGYADGYGMADQSGYQSSGPLPIQLHKNFLSRENLNHSVQQTYYNNNNAHSNTGDQYQGEPQHTQLQSNQFYLHDQHAGTGSPPVAPQRRTWAQSAAIQQQQKSESWSSAPPSAASPQLGTNKGSSGGGFMLHQNGADSESFLNDSANLFPVHTSSPQHSRVHRQISQIMDESSRASEAPQPMSRVSTAMNCMRLRMVCNH